MSNLRSQQERRYTDITLSNVRYYLSGNPDDGGGKEAATSTKETRRKIKEMRSDLSSLAVMRGYDLLLQVLESAPNIIMAAGRVACWDVVDLMFLRECCLLMRDLEGRVQFKDEGLRGLNETLNFLKETLEMKGTHSDSTHSSSCTGDKQT